MSVFLSIKVQVSFLEILFHSYQPLEIEMSGVSCGFADGNDVPRGSDTSTVRVQGEDQRYFCT